MASNSGIPILEPVLFTAILYYFPFLGKKRFMETSPSFGILTCPSMPVLLLKIFFDTEDM